MSDRQIIAFIGRAGSGKDYQCELLVSNNGFYKMAFADALRKILFITLNIPYEQGLQQYDSLKKTPLYNGQTLRDMMEHLGTEGIRYYDNDFWAKCMIKELQNTQKNKICVSDMRFYNEYHILKEFALRNNYDFKVIFCNYVSDRYQVDNTHASAKMANYFAIKAFNDLQEITHKDMIEYKEWSGE